MSKSKVEKGTIESFNQSRQRCISHLRSLSSIQFSRDCIEIIVQGWSEIPFNINAALHNSCAVAYARPFINSKTKKGEVRYPIKFLKGVQNFDNKLHKHIIDLRNRLIAHADHNVFRSKMFTQMIGDEKLILEVGINVKQIFGISSLKLAKRYLEHIEAVKTGIEINLSNECKELTSEAKRFPLEFEKSHNIPVQVQKINATTENKLLPKPIGPSAEVSDPILPPNFSEYRYQTMTHKFPFVENGTYKFHENGVEKEIIFEIS